MIACPWNTVMSLYPADHSCKHVAVHIKYFMFLVDSKVHVFEKAIRDYTRRNQFYRRISYYVSNLHILGSDSGLYVIYF